ncbi:hypothetical protein BJY24_007296 [Nocardia transvalensis]|uniref:D-alanyl-D-alanine carboxypeptidase-like core domain-containing protein n=1 Tax=Nocardia transvalensis TaxID=37333 RepID=A0A7W9PLJ4_9NOCA|nr:M15 family metallopeptidase [Nocardia transvalensis]MBB5918384.1 hypothetical protein [Nocardia transvalensis]
MKQSQPARTGRRRGGAAALAALVIAAAAPVGLLAFQSLSSTGWSLHLPHGNRHREAGSLADGAVPRGVTIFDDDIPAVANLDPALRSALRLAATDAADDGVEFVVNSGWRSAEYQEQLLREAVSKYGSAREAARWVADSTTSAHVSGDAVDIGPTAAAAWLSRYGAAYGLCQIYRNEPWHYELRPEAAEYGCPPLYADPTHDPRMRQQ